MNTKAQFDHLELDTFDDLVAVVERNALSMVTSHNILSKGLDSVNAKLCALTAAVLIFGVALYAFNESNNARITKLEENLPR